MLQEQRTTTEKNDLILTKVKHKGENGYRIFKELLIVAGQGKIVEFLTRSENGQETDKMEKELYEMAEKHLPLSPNYFKLKKGKYIFTRFVENWLPGLFVTYFFC